MKTISNPFELIYGKGFEADMASLKSKMLIILSHTLRSEYANRDDMAEAISCSKPQLSAIMNGKLGTLSFEKLSRYLYALDIRPECQLQIDDEVIALHIDIQQSP